MSRPTPQPFNLPAGLSVGATLAFARAAYALRGPDAEVTLPVVGLLVDVEAEKAHERLEGEADASTTWTRHTGAPSEYLDLITRAEVCPPSLYRAAVRLVARFAPPADRYRALWLVAADAGHLATCAGGALPASEAAAAGLVPVLDDTRSARPTMTGEGLV
jgi:hypothetical protein